MKEIELTRGKTALVDDDDYEWLIRFNWYYATRGCAETNCKLTRKVIKMHRLLIDVPPNMVIDHINGNPLDNRKSNLRVCTQAQNVANKTKQKRNTSGFKGVYWMKREKKWIARIKRDGKFCSLGYFHDKVEAAKAYDKAAIELFGEYACPNFKTSEKSRQATT